MQCVCVSLYFYKVFFNYKPFCQRASRVLSSKRGGVVSSPKLRLFVCESHEQPVQGGRHSGSAGATRSGSQGRRKRMSFWDVLVVFQQSLDVRDL